MNNIMDLIVTDIAKSVRVKGVKIGCWFKHWLWISEWAASHNTLIYSYTICKYCDGLLHIPVRDMARYRDEYFDYKANKAQGEG